MSEIVLSKESALICYRHIRQWRDSIQPAVFHKNVRLPSIVEIEHLFDLGFVNAGYISVLLFNSRNHNGCKNICVQYYSKGRYGVVVSIKSNNPFFLSENILLVSPAFMLAQFAKTYDFLTLLKLAFELAGSYTLGCQHHQFQGGDKFPELLSQDYYDSNFINNIEPILTKKSLIGIIDKLKFSRWAGMSKLEKVLRYLEENSASPMESELYIKMALSTNDGGLGLNNLKLNKIIELNDDAVKISRQSYIKVDILHKKSKVVIEYDSRQFHSDIDQSQRDKRRRDALQSLGYKCFSIVPCQICDQDTFNACMKPVVKAIKGRYRNRNNAFKSKQRELFRIFNSQRKEKF